MIQFSDEERYAIELAAPDDLYLFNCYMFACRRGFKWLHNWHHKLICEKLEAVYRGEIKRLIINIPPRYSKCVDPSTRVMTDKGLIPAKEIRAGDLIYSHDEGKLVLEPCLGTEPAKKESLKIIMRSGREIIVSHDHPMLGIEGYTKAEDFCAGDRIKTVNAVVDGGLEISDDELLFISFMIFEGNCSEKMPRYTGADNLATQKFLEVCGRLGVVVKKYPYSKYDYHLMGGKSGKAYELLSKYGIMDHLCYDKRLPRNWFSLSLRQKYMLLDVMFATDGYVATRSGQIGIALANEGLIDDIQHILSTCGIISTKTYKPNKKRGAWGLSVGREYAIKLLDKITFYHKRDSALTLLSKESQSLTDTIPSKVFNGVKGFWYWSKFNGKPGNKKNVTRANFKKCVDKFPELAQYISDDFYWDEIKEIVPVGKRELIHLQVNRTENFIANGMVSHNTELAVVNFTAWALGKNPDAEFIHASYSATLAAKNSGEVRNVMQTEEYMRIFGALLKSEAKAHLTTTKGGAFYTTGTGGTLTGFGAGKPRKEFGGAIILDDLHKADEARSDTMRQNVIDWFQNTLESRANSRDTPIIVIMQRLHEDDIAGFLLNGGNGEDWEHLCLPAIQPNGSALWPKKHSTEDLRRMERASPYVFAGQYMQNPAPIDGGLFKPDQIAIVDAIPAGDVRWCRGWDLGATVGGDPTAGANIGVYGDGRIIIADVAHGDKGPDERDAMLRHTAALDGYKVTQSIPQDPGQAGKTQALYLTRMLSGYKVVTSPETGDKVTRAEPFAAQVNAGNVMMLRGHWNKLLIDEMRLFPNGKHDDCIDACSRAFGELTKRGRSYFG